MTTATAETPPLNEGAAPELTTPATKAVKEVKESSKRKYSGPVKGSDAARAQMKRVREAQYIKQGLLRAPN